MVKRIAFAGVGSGVGTTTQALQMYHFAEYFGDTACILMERKQLENYRKDAKYEKYSMEQIDMQPGNGYDYLIIDYGNADAPGFRKENFAAEPAKIIVTMKNALGNTEIEKRFGQISDFHQIVTFPREGARRGEKVHYAGRSCDPHVFTEEDIFQSIMEDCRGAFEARERKGLLSVFGKKKGQPETSPKKKKIKRKPFLFLSAFFTAAIFAAIITAFRLIFPDMPWRDLIVVIEHYLLLIP